MRRFRFNIIALAVGLALGAGANAQELSKADYTSAKERISGELRAATVSCGAMSGNAKDVCMAQAKGVDHIALADLEHQYKPTARTRYQTRVARAESEHAVARERCDDMAGNAKDVCRKEAKAIEVSALADAKTQMTSTEASRTARERTESIRKDGEADSSDARLQVAREKCDDMAGTAKESCLNAAGTRFGKP